MHIRQMLSFGSVAIGLACAVRARGISSIHFAGADVPAGWTVTGDVSVDAGRSRSEGTGSLRVGPKGRAVLKLRDTNGSGSVDLWVYEDGSVPAKPKTRLTGPYYGVVQNDGRVLAPGSLYAPYLSGNTTYALTAFSPAAREQSYFAVQYLGIKRTEGWHRWTFAFDPENGVTVSHNGKDVNAARERFQWHKTKIEGFVGIVISGDATPDANQTVWIDDVSVTLGPPMAVKPADQAPPPPPPMTPDADPAPDRPAEIVEALRDVHPRLLFSAADIPAMRERVKRGYGKRLFEGVLRYLPACRKPDHRSFQRDATDAQRQGFWRLPTVALHYVLTGEKASFDRTIEFMELFLGLENWETGELDSGMGSANIMVGAALAYDWLYNDLEPGFRRRYRDKLLLMARRQYHQGHLMKLKGTHYWQGDPANNHRFHRNAGLTLAALAAADSTRTDDDWLLTRTLDEIRFIVEWLPHDGSSHESPTYAVFGNTHLLLAVDAAQRCYGEPFLDHPFFRNTAAFKLQTMRPDMGGVFGFGDCGSGTRGYNNFVHRVCAYHELADLQAGLAEAAVRNENFLEFTWFSVIWWRPLPGGSPAALPRQILFPDVGVVVCRTGWTADDVGAMFKCGPFGGYSLNRYRHRNGMRYVNVAHDDPDANSFQIFAGGAMLAETDRYSKRKRSSNYNTILINGAGQVAAGRPEGAGWSQPGGNMAEMGVITALGRRGDAFGIEGEAAGSYLANPRRGPKRPALDRFRRAFLWLEGRYILVLDDIRAPSTVELTWLMQGPELQTVDTAAGRYVLRKDEAACPFQVVAETALTGEVAVSTADHRGKALGWQQLQLKGKVTTARLASVYDPWGKGALTVALATQNDDTAVVTVTGPHGTDTWEWTAGDGGFAPSRIVGTSGEGAELLALEDEEPETRRLLAEVAEENP